MTTQALEAPRFIRKTQLAPDEYRKNFHQIDREVMAVITSLEADQVTPLMSKIYLRLVNAPDRYWERDGVLRIEAELRDNDMVKAWAVLCELLGVASATASKAIRWMHGQGIIGYFSGKNGVGLRIFLNRAVSSIGVRTTQGGQKILAFPPASFSKAPASQNEPAFNDSFAVSEDLDPDINPRAPKGGAEMNRFVKTPSESDPVLSILAQNPSSLREEESLNATGNTVGKISVNEIVQQLKAELEPSLESSARRAAAREHERTREWLENRGLPKAARVAQREAYNVLRTYGVIKETSQNGRSHAEIGRNDYVPPEPHRLSEDEVTELAQACIALLESQGQTIDRTLSEMSVEAGGFLLQEDAAKVRDKAEALFNSK